MPMEGIDEPETSAPHPFDRGWGVPFGVSWGDLCNNVGEWCADWAEAYGIIVNAGCPPSNS